MTDELKESAERLRLVKSGVKLSVVYSAHDWQTCYARRDLDRAILADAYLSLTAPLETPRGTVTLDTTPIEVEALAAKLRKEYAAVTSSPTWSINGLWLALARKALELLAPKENPNAH